jgi:nucleotide-binding universal stress UspA family protein
MYRRLLVPLDGTPESEAVLSPSSTLAAALNAEIVLISVLSASGSTLKGVLDSPQVSQIHDYLDGVAATLRKATASVEVIVSEGSPAETIAAEAADRGADLIAMTTHGRTGLQRLVIGSVAERVLARSPVPVLLMRPSEYRTQQIRLMLVPVDGTAGSLLAVGTAANLARSAGAAVVLLRVVVPLPLWIFDPTLGLNTGPLIDPRWDEDRRENAENYVRQLASRLAESGLETGADAVLGEPAASIAEYADQQGIDLIVMSTHKRPSPARGLLGSVADAVVRSAHQPVLLVNREMAAGSMNASASS